MLPTLSLGPLTLPTAGLVIILGLWLALSVVERAAARLQLDVPATYALSVVALASGFVAARLLFVGEHWDAYADNLLGIVWPLNSGFNLAGGLLAGVAAAVLYQRVKRLPPWPTLDALAPGLLVLLLALSLADFLAGPGFGERADLVWSIDLFGVRRHPVQLYEVGAGLLALAAWWGAVRARAEPGSPFLVAAAVYGAGRILSDAYRANAILTAEGYHVLQIVSLAIVVASLFLLARRAPEGRTEGP